MWITQLTCQVAVAENGSTDLETYSSVIKWEELGR